MEEFEDITLDELAAINSAIDSDCEYAETGAEEVPCIKSILGEGAEECENSEPIGGKYKCMTANQLKELSVAEWIRVLYFAPEHFKYCDFNKFSGDDWVRMLTLHPYFRKICDWGKLSENDWQSLIERRHGFKKIYDEFRNKK